MTALTEQDRQILDFERQWWKYSGAKEQAIRDLFDISATAYYQRLAAILDKPEALTFDAQLVNRLKRISGRRQQARQARTMST
jgi:hypothetical protein